MRGLTTHVSAPNISTNSTASLNKNMYTHGADPYLLIIRIILHHTTCALARFLTTTDQSSSATEITRPNYLKEFTISRLHPYGPCVLVYLFPYPDCADVASSPMVSDYFPCLFPMFSVFWLFFVHPQKCRSIWHCCFPLQWLRIIDALLSSFYHP